MKFRLYYKLFGYNDQSIQYGSLKAMQFDLRTMKASDFNYINACMICDDGSEEIIYSTFEEIINAI